MSHPHGSGGCPTLWGDSFGSFLLAAEKNISSPSETVHGGSPPRLKNSFSKTLSADVRREPAKAKELFIKKRFPQATPAETAKNNLI